MYKGKAAADNAEKEYVRRSVSELSESSGRVHDATIKIIDLLRASGEDPVPLETIMGCLSTMAKSTLDVSKSARAITMIADNVFLHAGGRPDLSQLVSCPATRTFQGDIGRIAASESPYSTTASSTVRAPTLSASEIRKQRALQRKALASSSASLLRSEEVSEPAVLSTSSSFRPSYSTTASSSVRAPMLSASEIRKQRGQQRKALASSPVSPVRSKEVSEPAVLSTSSSFRPSYSTTASSTVRAPTLSASEIRKQRAQQRKASASSPASLLRSEEVSEPAVLSTSSSSRPSAPTAEATERIDMAQTPDKLIQAKVQWWNRSWMYVRCPSCEEIHRHGFSGDYTKKHRRASPCAKSCHYEIQFPFGEGDTGYEIDKQRALFVAVGTDPTEYFLAKEPAFAQDMSSRRKWTEAMVWVISDLVQGKVGYVRQYLDDSADSSIFLHGVDGTSGTTALHLAACEKYPQMLELLLQKGADPNATDAHGRVPLVEAALWGRLENVQVLLKHGANKELECVRDGLRLRAIDLARPLRANAKERYERSGSKDQNYHENTYERDQDRNAIVRLLEDEVERERLSQDRRSLGGFAFTKSPKDENILTLVAHFDIPNKWKTIGVLYRGHQHHCVAAMSGWTHTEDPVVKMQIAGRSWTAEVRRLCETIGHSLAPHQYDQGEPGRYHACHAEKQLIAFFVSKHLFLHHEIEDSIADLNLNELSDEEYRQRKKERALRRELTDLKGSEPATPLRKATILVCRPICSDCNLFVEQVNRVLGIDITVFYSCL